MSALATRQIAVHLADAQIALEVRPTGDGRTVVGTTCREPAFDQLSGRVLVQSDLTTDATFRLFGEILAAAWMLGQNAPKKTDWLKTIGEGAETVKNIFDALSSIQGFLQGFG
jgi:hypothetical protein